MIERSYALDVVWQFAAEEALNAGAEQIEPVHLLMGVCSIEKLFSADLSKVQLTPYALASTRAEWEEISAVLMQARLSPSALRRQLRNQLPSGTFPTGEPRKLSRAPAARAAFQQAEENAVAVGSKLVGVLYLLDALLQQEDMLATVAEYCFEVKSLKSDVAAAARRPLLAEPQITRKASTTAPVDKTEVKKVVKAAMGGA